jgi:lysophospholipase L1-like esterase
MPTSRIRSLNNQIKAITEQQQVKYLNVFDSMLDENDVLKKAYSTDGIHLTQVGYQAWASTL